MDDLEMLVQAMKHLRAGGEADLEMELLTNPESAARLRGLLDVEERRQELLRRTEASIVDIVMLEGYLETCAGCRWAEIGDVEPFNMPPAGLLIHESEDDAEDSDDDA